MHVVPVYYREPLVWADIRRWLARLALLKQQGWTLITPTRPTSLAHWALLRYSRHNATLLRGQQHRFLRFVCLDTYQFMASGVLAFRDVHQNGLGHSICSKLGLCKGVLVHRLTILWVNSVAFTLDELVQSDQVRCQLSVANLLLLRNDLDERPCTVSSWRVYRTFAIPYVL